MARLPPASQAPLALRPDRASRVRVIVSAQDHNFFAGRSLDLAASDWTAVSGGAVADAPGDGIAGTDAVQVTTTSGGDGAYLDCAPSTPAAEVYFVASVYLQAAPGTYPLVEAYVSDPNYPHDGPPARARLRPDRWTRLVATIDRQESTGSDLRLVVRQPATGGAACVFLVSRPKLERRRHVSRWTEKSGVSQDADGLHFDGDSSYLVETEADNETDLSDHVGRDWLASVEWSESADQPTGTARVVLVRDQDEGGASLSPRSGHPAAFHHGRTHPILLQGQHLRIEAQLAPTDDPEPDDDWTLVFDGRIDEIEWGSTDDNTVTLSCRDRSGQDLQDVQVREEQPEPAPISSWYTDLDWPQDSDEFLQALLDGVAGAGAWPLRAVGAPDWGFNQPQPTSSPVRKGPLLQLVRQIAESAGRMLRFQWDTLTQSYQLAFFDPDRSSTPVAGLTLDDDFVLDVRPSQSIVDQRTTARVWYSDKNDGGRRTWADAQALQPADRDLYGDRHCEISEASTGSTIDTATEAGDLAQAVVADLQGVDSSGAALLNRPWTIEVPLLPWVEVFDYVAIATERAPLYRDTLARVMAASHSWSEDGGWTTLTVVEVDAANARQPGKTLAGHHRSIAAPGVAPAASVTRAPQSVRLRVAVSSQVVPATETQVVAYDAPEYDRSGSWDAGLYAFTVPFDGVYRIAASVVCGSSKGGAHPALARLRVNGVPVAERAVAGTLHLDLSAELSLVAGHVVDVTMFNEDNSLSLSVTAASAITIERVR